MRVTQGTFCYLPDLTDEQIRKQIQYAINQGWAVSVEYTDDPHPRNSYWEMWGLPLFDVKDPATIMFEVQECRKQFPNHYIKVLAFNSTKGIESTALSFIVNRPANEPGFVLRRIESNDRVQRYQIHSYATEKPEGSRY
jgi:ribulose-bisphosphate carboxylase small chain|uniref:Ribulose bisphosphate carboxylase small subunit n=2 Tax=Cyanidioschyzon merolae TaxID=45157 RepID=RBS_CYAM1|nr:ribulose-1,5-bisphosphate carboxylase/oxygenase small subunit [Cyanidioschyzon merolae strain 10D]O22024.1 RecName: Full=Ribulose bisphosphate carboxylase small subunit; Short=RuBisCO small subunit [Cyanidioschyzon merolae strain 10D]QFV16926.1 ribulose bisphosphate carboxylase small chain [Cyanidioschyzon merolae]QFV17105.1 ribulose bisphosphate carboxylase small chain [Cyanidioschyzon merolae]BAA22820.1 ribulosebiphosphate carboxylase small subunit [Cyanidioschyzon merolae]BAC76108.1 ribu